MNVLVVYTHPLQKSLNGAFLHKTLEGLNINKNVDKVDLLDLYRDGFNPILALSEDRKRKDLYKDPDLKRYRDQIEEADILVFIYPIWWGRPPAMLLGYIDQVFVSNFAYKYRHNKRFPEGLLKGKKAICISTMKGPTGYPWLFLGNAHKKLMKKALFNFVGIKDVYFFEFGGMEKPKGKQTYYLQKVAKYMRSLS